MISWAFQVLRVEGRLTGAGDNRIRWTRRVPEAESVWKGKGVRQRQALSLKSKKKVARSLRSVQRVLGTHVRKYNQV